MRARVPGRRGDDLGGCGLVCPLVTCLAGARLVKDTAKSALATTRLEVRRGTFVLTTTAVDREWQRLEGRTPEIASCQVEVIGYVNSSPVSVVRIVEGARVIDVGKGLQLAEQEWIAHELAAFLAL